MANNVFIWGDAVRVGATPQDSVAITPAPAAVFANLNLPPDKPILGRQGRTDAAMLAILVWYCAQRGYDPVISIDADVYWYAKRCAEITGDHEALFADGDEPGATVTAEVLDAWVEANNIATMFEAVVEPEPSKDDKTPSKPEDPPADPAPPASPPPAGS